MFPHSNINKCLEHHGSRRNHSLKTGQGNKLYLGNQNNLTHLWKLVALFGQ